MASLLHTHTVLLFAARSARKIRLPLPGWAILLGILGTQPVIYLFDSLGKLNLFLPAFDSIAVLATAIVVKWDLRRLPWFWVTLFVLTAFQTVIILLVPWTTLWVPAMAITGIGCLYLVVVLAAFNVVGQVMNGSGNSEGRVTGSE